jgi:hypothetical protein
MSENGVFRRADVSSLEADRIDHIVETGSFSSMRQQFSSDNIFSSEANHKQFLTGDIEAHMLFFPSFPFLRLLRLGCK